MAAVKGKGWSPERRARQAQRIRDTMAANPGMVEAGRAAALVALATPEGRAHRLASAAAARKAWRKILRRKGGAKRRKDAAAKAKTAAALFWSDPVRVAAAQAKRRATLAATNKRKQMAGLQTPPGMRALAKKLSSQGVKGPERLAMLFALRDKEAMADLHIPPVPPERGARMPKAKGRGKAGLL